MDFLKNCGTNILTTDRFASIEFSVNVICDISTLTENVAGEGSFSNRANEVLSALFDLKKLAFFDREQKRLWMFAGGGQNELRQDEANNVAQSKGLSLKTIHVGEAKASDLCEPSGSSTLASTVSTPSSASTPTLIGRHLQPLSARTPKSAVSAESHDKFPKIADTFEPGCIYRMFIAAVLSLTSYALASSQAAIPLGCREFLSLPYSTKDADNSCSLTQPQHYYLSSIYVQLTIGGHLIISFSSGSKITWMCLINESRKKDVEEHFARIAPSGMAVKILQVEGDRCESGKILHNNISATRGQKGCRKTTKWKRKVLSWLQEHGLHLEESSSQTRWLWIELPRIADYSNDQHPSVQNRQFLWPASLCFYPVGAKFEKLEGALPASTLDHLAIFDNNDNDIPEISQSKQVQDVSADENRNPLHIAEDFLLNKISVELWHRDDARANHLAEPSSPFQTRLTHGIDSQVPNGIYPTPPDCVTGPLATLAEITSATTATGDNSMYSETASPRPDDQVREKLEISPDIMSVRGGEQDAFQTFEASENELLDEMDRDEMEGAGITDADFNFFDEPDVDMEGFLVDDLSGTTALEVQDAELQPETIVKAAPDSTVDKPNKDLHIIAAADNENSEFSSDDKSIALVDEKNYSLLQGDRIGSLASVKLKEQKSSGDTNYSHQNNPQPAESPVQFKTLLPCEASDFDNGCSFNPMRFGENMTISDAKYNFQGRYNFNQMTDVRVEHESDTYASLPQKARRTVASNVYLPKSLRTSLPNKRPPYMMLPAAKLSQNSENEASQSDISELLESELSDSGTEQSSNSLGHEEEVPLYIPMQNNDEIASRKRLRSQYWRTNSEKVLSEKTGCLDITGDTLEALQPNVDGELHVTVQRTPKIAFGDLCRCQNPAKPHTHRSKIITNIDNGDQVGSTSSNSVQVHVQTVQILVDQIAKGTLDLLQEDDHSPLDSETIEHITNEMIEDHLLLSAKYGALPFAHECDIVQFASLEDASYESTQFQKFQARSLIRRSSTEGSIHSLMGELFQYLFRIPALLQMNTISIEHYADLIELYSITTLFSRSIGNHIHPMLVPLLRLQRYDSLLEVSSSALAFWEALGLAPANGPKNVRAYCICPDTEDHRELIDHLLISTTVAYESCKFGAHSRGRDFGRYKDGIIPAHMTGNIGSPIMSDDLQEFFITLGTDLAKVCRLHNESPIDDINYVVLYVANPSNDMTSVWKICYWFLLLRQEFQRSLSTSKEKRPAIEINLQLIPMESVASFTELHALQSDYHTRLASEVYDRCHRTGPIDSSTGPDILCAPALQLAEPLPKSIPFKLSPDPPADLLSENAYMHVAYAKSTDDRWITAAWTDNSGKRQAHVTYNLEGKRSFSDVARELWQTTSEIIQRRKVNWKVIIVAVRGMDQEEMDAWIALVTIPTQPIVFTLLLTVEPDSPIRLSTKDTAGDSLKANCKEQAIHFPSSDSNPGGSPTVTHASEAVVGLRTEELDGNLVDINDETWAVTLAHRQNVSKTLTDYRPCLASGLLVKRTGDGSCHSSAFPVREATSGPMCMALDLLRICNSSGNTNSNGSNSAGTSSALHVLGPRGYDHMLREILFMYGSLGLLAKYRGMRDTRGGLLPWHVVMASRGIKALEYCLP